MIEGLEYTSQEMEKLLLRFLKQRFTPDPQAHNDAHDVLEGQGQSSWQVCNLRRTAASADDFAMNRPQVHIRGGRQRASCQPTISTRRFFPKALAYLCIVERRMSSA